MKTCTACTYKRSLGLLRCRRVPLPFSIERARRRRRRRRRWRRRRRRRRRRRQRRWIGTEGREERKERRTEREREGERKRKIVAGRSRSAPATVSFQTIHGGRYYARCLATSRSDAATYAVGARRGASRRLASRRRTRPLQPYTCNYRGRNLPLPSISLHPPLRVTSPRRSLSLARSLALLLTVWTKFREWKKGKCWM